MLHFPVMLVEALGFLAPRPGGVYCDCTLGLGGHSLAISKLISPGGRLVCLDRDDQALSLAKERLAEHSSMISYHKANFSDLTAILSGEGLLGKTDGILADLGASSLQFQSPDRGFSFSDDGPLDMRMDPSQALTAEYIINRWNERDIADILYKYGEEHASRRIARAIVEIRRKMPINRTKQLADIIIKNSRPPKGRWRIHPATRSFMAIRIAVNGELENLKALLDSAEKALAPGGRLVVISFHSLEDRMVKLFLRERKDVFMALSKKPLVPSPEETEANPPSRSAKLRAAELVRL